MSERPNDDLSFDVIGDVLETLRFRGSIFFRSDLAAPWGLRLDPVGIPRFHVALAGDCFVGEFGKDGDISEVRVKQAEVVMLPTGNSHWIADQPGRELISSDRAGIACELNDPLFQTGVITNRLMCGIVHYDQESPHPLLDALPSILHFPGADVTATIWSTITMIDQQMQQLHIRSRPIVDRLTEVLFLQLLNAYIERESDATGFVAALRDRRIQRALSLIHREPDYDWSLESLGKRVGMSTATLVRHFHETVGIAPMTYLKNWRIMKAYNLVRYTSTPLEQIAEKVGFSSARTLTRSFRRHYKTTPSRLRRAR